MRVHSRMNALNSYTQPSQPSTPTNRPPDSTSPKTTAAASLLPSSVLPEPYSCAYISASPTYRINPLASITPTPEQQQQQLQQNANANANSHLSLKLDTQSSRMYESKRKASRETCTSSPSPASSPATPVLSSPPPPPVFAEHSKRSATLDSIGAWSSVQLDSASTSASAARAYESATDIQALGKRYDALNIGHSNASALRVDLDEKLSHDRNQNVLGFLSDSHPTHTRSNVSATTADSSTSPNGDYNALDEAILRGRSTAVPNIFAMPNPLRRFSTTNAIETPVPSGPISPVSSSNFGLLSRHGSISYESGNRAVSPLGFSLGMSKMHQASSLDIQLTSPIESRQQQQQQQQPVGANRFGAMPVGSAGTPIGLDTSSMLPNTDVPIAPPVRRFSAYTLDPGHSLALASYSMSSAFVPGATGGNGVRNAQADEVSSALTDSGVSHAASSGAAFSKTQANNTMASNNSSRGVFSNGLSDGSAYSSALSYGSFGLHLPTMHEEDHQDSSALSPPLVDPAMHAGLQASTSITSPASPIRRDLAAESADAFLAAADSAGAVANGSSLLPLRVKSLKDMRRRPSLDANAGMPSDSMALPGRSSVDAFVERASELHQQYPVHPLSSMSALHRRHSLASTGLHMLAPGGIDGAPQHRRMGLGALGHASGPGQGLESSNTAKNSDYPLHPPFPNTGQGGMQLPFVPQHQQYPGPFPLARMPPGNGSLGPIPRPAFFGGPMAAPPPMPQPHLSFQPAPMPPGHAPPTISPMTPTAQQLQQQQPPLQPPQIPPPHMRRASHPAITHGVQLPNIPQMPPAPALVGGLHPIMPNPATTITPNMPFADMGKGILYQTLPKDTRVFVVQFKGKRRDLYFSPTKGTESKLIPPQAASAIPIPASSTSKAPTEPSGATFEPGTYVLVEADRGVDLGMIREELTTPEAVKAVSKAIADAACAAANAGSSIEQQPDGSSSKSRTARGAELASSGSVADGSNARATPAQLKSSSSTASTVCDQEPSSSLSLLSSASEQTVAAAAASGQSSVSSGLVARDVYIKRIFREADQREVADMLGNKVLDEQKALAMCQSKVMQRRLSMSVVDAEFQFDRRKLTFYFTADRRVDFRELVRELFKHFKTRIWMCQQTN